MGPACHPLCAIKVYFLYFFSPSDFWLFPFSFDPLPPWKRMVSCWLMGPACHPLCTIKLSFFGLFLAPHIWSLDFFFRSPAASQTVRPLQLNGTRMSSSMSNQLS